MKIMTFFLTFALLLGLTITVSAQAKGDLTKAERRAEHSAKVFREIMEAPDKGIPQYIIDRAEAIAVFPSVIKAGFIIGGRHGDGLVSIRDPQTREWQPPIFLSLSGGSFGAQIGGQSIDLVLVGMNRRSVDLFTKDRFKLGGELSISAGPVGRNAEASTDLPTIRSEFLSYSRSRGLFVGAMISGAVIKQDKDLNQAVYGERKLETFQNVAERKTRASMKVMVFPQTLSQYSGKRSGA